MKKLIFLSAILLFSILIHSGASIAFANISREPLKRDGYIEKCYISNSDMVFIGTPKEQVEHAIIGFGKKSKTSLTKFDVMIPLKGIATFGVVPVFHPLNMYQDRYAPYLVRASYNSEGRLHYSPISLTECSTYKISDLELFLHIMKHGLIVINWIFACLFTIILFLLSKKLYYRIKEKSK